MVLNNTINYITVCSLVKWDLINYHTMTKVYYLLDLNHGSFEDRGTYPNLVTAKAQLKTFKEKGFEKAFLVKVTEERIKLDDERIVRILEQAERFKKMSDSELAAASHEERMRIASSKLVTA